MTVEISHDHKKPQLHGNKKKHDLAFTHEDAIESSAPAATAIWHATNPFSIVLPLTNTLSWTPKPGTINKTNGVFDPNTTVVIDAEASNTDYYVGLTFTTHPTNGMTSYAIAIRHAADQTSGRPRTMAAYYNYDMMEATLTWDDLSTRLDQ